MTQKLQLQHLNMFSLLMLCACCVLCSGYTMSSQPVAGSNIDASLPYVRSKRGGQMEAIPRSREELQSLLYKVKATCARKLNFPETINEKVLLHEQHPTPKEKCLMECVLRGVKLMDENNKLSLNTIAQLASMISDKNELIMAIAIAKAENCNRQIEPTKQPCEVANQLNKCIGRELSQHRVKLAY